MIIRSATPSDAADVQAIYGPVVANTPISFEVEPPTVEEMAKRIANISKTRPYLVADVGGQVVGFAYATEHRSRAAYKWSVDVTAYVAEGIRRSGVGKKLYAELLHQLSERGFHAAFAGIALPNSASVGLHEAMGFRHLGTYNEVGFKFERWHDVGWWQRLITQD